jgi:hypothetical protein
MVVRTCNPTTHEADEEGLWGAGQVTQAIEHLPSKHEYNKKRPHNLKEKYVSSMLST